ncbi:hypothetical protein EHI8A_017930 [Entamoeba histolytica HM-1:IMSS-B]|uniref:Uncharacterized protein n=6 Tax=Entamoeba histolytica TaxID=5759 RepID=C4LWY8_ENTH1|nr:hypothetical protein EHI_127150 [Entamoeba histolytica HM-1:IMSS]EMD45409.1 Hypothetical protein EHI5A_031410 [Entamoeba histolytica KU27]EMH73076.1 hypothetical protein EHI8A_017930 [Entamoeba histolytica HM-1:IMSS-B]EMS11599.1 hypothetical protein KM1_039990 [Entamoeba histolytica HM-3:IMSS]ENY64739.1 hypothetical protein EHI7A_072460 [Entamoeba histolytica HM-1:IMSS-A]GAT93237.1 hypothetical protein CL6EHI_127150 [Entamoeba histolytica]|eukprot:XP_652179.1 hypothetical protein EHI_127150 [Entamoeba histolytica HM-1:IMSS]
MSSFVKSVSSTEIKRESKSFEAVQQAVLIALLNYLGYSIEIKHPERLAAKTVQFLIVTELFYEGKSLNFGEEIEEICSKRYEGERSAAPNIKKIRQTRRHKDINRAALTFNRLLQLVEKHGYKVKRRYTKSSFKTLRMEKITDILLNEKIIIDTVQINNIGRAVNSVITKTFKKGPYKTTMIEVRNEVLMSILQQVPYFKNTIPLKENQKLGIPETISFDPIDLPLENPYTTKYIPDDDFNDYSKIPSSNISMEINPPMIDRIYDITSERMKELDSHSISNQVQSNNQPQISTLIDNSDNKSIESKYQGNITETMKQGRSSPVYKLMFRPVEDDSYFQQSVTLPQRFQSISKFQHPYMQPNVYI